MARASPLSQLVEGGRYNPARYHNLVANPRVTVEVGTETFEAVARVVEGEERERIFRERARPGSRLEWYEGRTTRVIPVVVLERAESQ